MKITLGITGASGSIYAIRLIEKLCAHEIELSVIVTEMGLQVCLYETQIHIKQWLAERNIRCYDVHNLFAPPASGTNKQDAVIIMPCSMGTLGRIAHGLSENLLERVADVALKERFQLILCPRETPLNLIHLKNMLRSTEAGAVVAPITVGFYTKPQSLQDVVDFHVGKVMDLIGLRHDCFVPWGRPL